MHDDVMVKKFHLYSEVCGLIIALQPVRQLYLYISGSK